MYKNLQSRDKATATYPLESFPKYENCLIGYEEANEDKIQRKEDHILKVRYRKSGLMDL